MALIKVCRKCGRTTDRPPYNQHAWIDMVCFRCGGAGNAIGYNVPYIPKDFRFKYLANPPVRPSYHNRSIFNKLTQSIRCVA